MKSVIIAIIVVACAIRGALGADSVPPAVNIPAVELQGLKTVSARELYLSALETAQNASRVAPPPALTTSEIVAARNAFKSMVQAGGAADPRRATSPSPAESRGVCSKETSAVSTNERILRGTSPSEPTESTLSRDQDVNLKELHARLTSLLDEVSGLHDRLLVIREKVRALGVMKEGW